MKPSDLYLSGRQFFAYAVPGAIWLAAMCLFVGRNPVELIEAGHEAIRVLVRLSIFTVGAYSMGFGAHKLFFWLATNWYTPTAPNNNTGRSDLFCKLYVIQNSRQLRSAIAEREVGINLRVGLPPAFVALSIGLIIYTNVWGQHPVYARFGVAGLAVGFLCWLMLWFVPRRSKQSSTNGQPRIGLSQTRQQECAEWCEMFKVLKESPQTTAEQRDERES